MSGDAAPIITVDTNGDVNVIDGTGNHIIITASNLSKAGFIHSTTADGSPINGQIWFRSDV